MRILGGKAKGRKIPTLATKKTRPTLQIVRKSIFDTLGEEVKGAHILDLFAGAGSLGLEALSRGSQEVTFVDDNQGVLDKLGENAKLLGFKEMVNLVNADATKTLHSLWKNRVKYDIVFADPPYSSKFISKVVETFEVCDVIRNGGLLVIEHSKHTPLPHHIGLLILWKVKEFGETHVSFYRKQKERS